MFAPLIILTLLQPCHCQIEEVTVSKMFNCFIYFSLKISLIEVQKKQHILYVSLGYKITLVNGLSHKLRDTCAVNCISHGACCRKDCVGTYLCSLHHVLSVNQMSHCNDNLVSDTPCSLFVVFLCKTTKSV
jgi:hypothetical protein